MNLLLDSERKRNEEGRMKFFLDVDCESQSEIL